MYTPKDMFDPKNNQTVPAQNLHHKPGKPYPDFRWKHNVQGKYFHWSTLISTQTKVHATIIMVIYTHTGLRDNKYQNFGWYGYVPGCTNPKSASQIRQTVPRFSLQTQGPGKTFLLVNPHKYPSQGTSHYYHGNIRSYRSEGQ